MAEVSTSTVVGFGANTKVNLSLKLLSKKDNEALVELLTPYPDITTIFTIRGYAYPPVPKVESITETITFMGEAIKPLARVATKILQVYTSANSLQYDILGSPIPNQVPKIGADLASCYYPDPLFSEAKVEYQYIRLDSRVTLDPNNDTVVLAMYLDPRTNQKVTARLTIPLSSGKGNTVVGIGAGIVVEPLDAPTWWYYIPVTGVSREYLEFRASYRAYMNFPFSVSTATSMGTVVPKEGYDTTKPERTPSTGAIYYPTVLSPKPTTTPKPIKVREAITLSNSYYTSTSKPMRTATLTVVDSGAFVDSSGNSVSTRVQEGAGRVEPLYEADPKGFGYYYTGNSVIGLEGRTVMVYGGGYLIPITGTMIVEYETYAQDIYFESNGFNDSSLLEVKNIHGNATIVVEPPKK